MPLTSAPLTPARYLGIDLETTGLEEDAALLELSALILDADLRVLASYTALVRPPTGALTRLSSVVADMHSRSGLLRDLHAAPTLKSILEVERDLLALLDEHEAAGVPIHVAGGGVAQYDQPYLTRWMPTLAARLHYRPMDFSIIRQAYRDATGTALPVPRYEHPHRADIDLQNDVEVGRIVFDMLRQAHRAMTGTAPTSSDTALAQAQQLLEETRQEGRAPAVHAASAELVEALLTLVAAREAQPV